MKSRKTSSVGVLFLCIVLSLLSAAVCEAASKSPSPEYEPNGTVSGTPLLYQNLAVNQHGIAAVTIYNPTSTGISFSANFTFYDSKGQYLAGFSVSGFAAHNARTACIEEIDYKKIRKAAYVKVLGRSGRRVE
jgi:hypothetical protein